MSPYEEASVPTRRREPRSRLAVPNIALLLSDCASDVPTRSPPPTAARATPTEAPTLAPILTATP